MKKVSRAYAAGFTLMELMVTVVIVAILASVGWPMYNDYVIRSRIPRATGTLSELRVKMEQHFQDTRSYSGACAAGGFAEPPSNQPDFTYSCTIPAAGTSFTLKAEGKDMMNGFVFTIDEGNNRNTASVPTRWGRGPYTCWVSNKGGKC